MSDRVFTEDMLLEAIRLTAERPYVFPVEVIGMNENERHMKHRDRVADPYGTHAMEKIWRDRFARGW